MTPSEFTLTLPNAEATEALGRCFAQELKAGDVLALAGDLGAGKTTLSRGFIHGAGHRGTVKSPTFTLVEPYEHLEPPVYHFDLYRLASVDELEYIGFRDYLDVGICLIEWPELLLDVAFMPAAVVTLSLCPEGRRCSIDAKKNEKSYERIQRVIEGFQIKT